MQFHMTFQIQRRHIWEHTVRSNLGATVEEQIYLTSAI